MNQNTMWTVIEKRTGKRICECADERDAIMMILLGKEERSYHKKQYLNDQIIDISHQKIKELPGQLGLPGAYLVLEEDMQEVFVP